MKSEKMLLSLSILICSINGLASINSVCGPKDNRLHYKDSRIGRTRGIDMKASGCTATLIGKNCAITAGHCTFLLKSVEFNVPPSPDSYPFPSAAKDKYEVDESSIVSRDTGFGDDWAVFKLHKNSITQLLPGEANGLYPISNSLVKKGDPIGIAGYGVVWLTQSDQSTVFDFTLRKHSGVVQEINYVMYNQNLSYPSVAYKIDTSGGTSGAALVNQSTGEIVGIHTNGGCGENTFNSGVSLNANIDFRMAVDQCLNSEK